MPTRRSTVAVIFATVFLDLVGFGIVIPVLPLQARRFAASPAVIGLLLATYSAMQLLFAPLLGRLSDRVGRRPVLLLCLVGTCIGFCVMGFADSVAWLFLGRAIDGVSGGNVAIAQACIADVTSREERARALGKVGAAFGLGFTFGPAIAGIASQVSPELPFFVAAGLAAANAMAVYWLLPESLPAQGSRGATARGGPIAGLRDVARVPGVGALLGTCFLVGVAFASWTATHALVANRRFDLDAAQTGYLLACLGALGALVQGALLGPLLRALGEWTLAALGIALFAVSLFALGASPGIAGLLLASAGIVVGHAFSTPTLSGLASRRLDPARQGQLLGALHSCGSLARIGGALLGGMLLGLDETAFPGPYGSAPLWAAACVLLPALGLLLVSARRARDGAATSPVLGGMRTARSPTASKRPACS